MWGSGGGGGGNADWGGSDGGGSSDGSGGGSDGEGWAGGAGGSAGGGGGGRLIGTPSGGRSGSRTRYGIVSYALKTWFLSTTRVKISGGRLSRNDVGVIISVISYGPAARAASLPGRTSCKRGCFLMVMRT